VFQFGGAWSLVWGAKPLKAPRGDGTDEFVKTCLRVHHNKKGWRALD